MGKLVPDLPPVASVLHGQRVEEAAGDHQARLGRAGGEQDNGMSPDATEAKHDLDLAVLILV